MGIPQYSRLVTSAKEFWELAKGIVHVALERAGGRYFHHCIISSYFEKTCKVYEYFLAFKNFFSGPGKVGNRDVDKNEIENAIKKGQLYVIEAPNYPKTKQEMKEAYKRFWNRWNEKLYSLASNNCEHLVNYILTGNPYSEQIRKLGAWGMAFVDCFDALISRGKRAMLKMSGCLIAKIPARFFIQFAAREVVNIAATNIIHAPTVAASTDFQVGRYAKKICKDSHKFTKTQLLSSDTAGVAGKEAIKKSAVTSLVAGAVVESAFTLYDIYQLDELREKGIISDRDCRRETVKSLGGAACATGGSVAGGVIGQVICPIPVLGAMVGSTIGNVAGRLVGNAVSGLLFDEF